MNEIDELMTTMPKVDLARRVLELEGAATQFDRTIGKLDRILSLLMDYGRAAERGDLDDADAQTLKHHAEDMIGAAEAILGRLSQKPEGT